MIPPIADRFIAGESIDEAIDYTQSQNEDGIGIILNFLGEHHSDTARVQEDVSEYHALIERISQSETRAVISCPVSSI